jgi:hypothetical protein
MMTESSPWQKSWEEPWSYVLRELDREKKLAQEYTKHSAKFDNRQQNAPHPLK